MMKKLGGNTRSTNMKLALAIRARPNIVRVKWMEKHILSSLMKLKIQYELLFFVWRSI